MKENQWTRLHWLADLKVNRSAELLAQEQALLKQAQQQKDDFTSFKGKVAQAMREGGKNPNERLNALAFLDKLDEAIDVSERRIGVVNADVERARLAWQSHKTKTDAYQSLIDQERAMRTARDSAIQDRSNQEQFNQRKFNRSGGR